MKIRDEEKKIREKGCEERGKISENTIRKKGENKKVKKTNWKIREGEK